MIRYLVRRYVAIVLVLAAAMMVLPTVFGTSAREIAGAALFWSALAAVPLTYWEFRRRNLWVLYDRQCARLDADGDLRAQLAAYGYVHARWILSRVCEKLDTA